MPGAAALHAGEGPLQERIAAWHSRSPVRDRIHLLGPRDDIEQIFQAIDVFLLTSTREGLPNVILEAMACGVPVVSTDVGDCRELVRHGVNGFLAPCGARRELLDATRSFLADAQLRERAGREARQFVLDRHSLHGMIAQMAALYGGSPPLDSSS